MCDPCACVRPCVPCVSRLPPVPGVFLPVLYRYRTTRNTIWPFYAKRSALRTFTRRRASVLYTTVSKLVSLTDTSHRTRPPHVRTSPPDLTPIPQCPEPSNNVNEY